MIEPSDIERAELPPISADYMADLEEENDRLRAALIALVDETCDYTQINNLGDPEKQHNIKLARAALKGADHD